MAQPLSRYDSSGVSAVLKNNERRPTPPRKPYSQDFSSKLAELEEKLREQERFNSFLVDQINRVEGNLNKMYSRGAPASRGDDKFLRLEEELRKLSLQVGQANPSLNAYQQDTELLQMRNFIQEKLTEDQKLHQKHNEKGQVLFSELVRLGENYEKTNDFLQNLSMTLENRIMAIENRVNSGERQVVSIDNKSEGSMGLLMQLAEKVEKRIQMVESAFLALGGESEKNAKSIDRVESGAYRLQEDMKIFYKQLQTDIQSRLETKSGDLLNKLLQEQEERLRNHEDLRYNVEMKDKMTQEKINYDRNDFRSRVGAFESFVKTEFQRKEELINSINASLENQIRNIYETIRMNESMRQEREEQLSMEMANAVETNKQSIDQHKVFQSSITEKITEMVRTEIEVRQKGEKDLKNLTHSTMKGILQEISVQKDIIDRLKLKLEHDIQSAQASFSEKADLLSRYIEEETKRSSDLMKSQYNQTKDMITKLAESLKTTIISNEKWKGDVIKKFGKIDSHLQTFKADLNQTIDSNESRVMLKLRELQQTLESHLLTNTKVLESRIEALAAMVDSSLSAFDANLLNNREVFVEIINKLNAEILENHGVVCKDLQGLANEIQSFQGEIDSLTEALNEKVQEMAKGVAMIESETLVLMSNERLIRENMINRVSEDYDERIKEIEEKFEGFDERLNEEEKIQQGNDDKNNEKFKEIIEKVKKVSKVAKGSKTGLMLEAEEKETNKIMKAAQDVVNDLIRRVEINENAELVHNLRLQLHKSEEELSKIKEMIAKKVGKLKVAHSKLSEESRLAIEEIFDKKVAVIQEKLKRDSEKLWQNTVNKVKEPKMQRGDDLLMLNERISSIATTERELFKPKLRL